MIINVDSEHTEVFSNKLRDELLSWVNNILKSKFMKIEELCTGAAYCQLIHSIYPNSISIRNVKFVTNLEHECVDNYKILQRAFQKLGVTKSIPISRLCSGRFRENFDFLVWFRMFYEANATKIKYDPVAVRKGMPMKYGPVEIRRIYEQREKDALKDKVLLYRMKAGLAERLDDNDYNKKQTTAGTITTTATGTLTTTGISSTISSLPKRISAQSTLKRSATQTLIKRHILIKPKAKFLSAGNSAMEIPNEVKKYPLIKRNSTHTVMKTSKKNNLDQKVATKLRNESKGKDPFSLRKRIKELERSIELKNQDAAEKDIELTNLQNENNELREELCEIKRDRDIYFDKMHRVAVCCRDAQYKAEFAIPISTVLDIFLEETIDTKRKLKTRMDNV